MRILIISPFFYPHVGGSQRYMEELYASLLRTYTNVKVDVLTYNTSHAPKRESYKKMTIHRIDCFQILPGQFAVPNPLQLIMELLSLAQYPYDVIHANTRFFESSWWAWGYAKMIGAKSVLTDHVASHPRHHVPFITLMARYVDRIVSPIILRQYDLVTATNNKTLQFLRHTLHCSTAVLLYGGIDTTYFKPSKRIRRAIPHIRQLFRKNHTIVTFAGRLIDTKGPQYFLKAALALLPKLPKNIYFVIAGGGPLKSSLNNEIMNHHKSNRIFMTGELTQNEIRVLFQSSDIVIHPSYHAEGFPNILLEAGATQNFVIATNNAGTNEIITHKKNGILIPQKNSSAIEKSIVWAISHKKERVSASVRLRSFIVEQFAWKEKSVEFFSYIRQLFISRNHSRFANV